MKKNLLVLCFIVLLGSLIGCSSKQSDSSIKKVGIIQVVEHDSLNTIRKSFEEEILKDNVEIIYKNANGDMAMLDTLIQQMVNDKVDIIVAIATPSAQAAAKYAKKIPVVFSAVSDPIGAGLVDNLKNPTKNITGTSDEIQVDQILSLAQESYPKTKNIGFIYNSSETNSRTNLDKAKKYAKEHNLNIVEAPISSVSDIQTRLQTLLPKVDLLFAPNDNTIASSMDILKAETIKAKKPFFSGADSMVKDGALATVGIDYDELGKDSARIVKDILDGTAANNIPVKVFKEDLNVYINKTTANMINFKDIEKIKKNHSKVIELS